MKPLISYYGGKQRMASKIVPLIPPHTVYCEPFAGGASLLFAKPRHQVGNKSDYLEVLNDTDGNLINLYRCFQDHTKADELIHRLQFTLYSKAEHTKAMQIMRETGHDEVTRAWAYYVNIQQSFTNGLNKGWGRAVMRNHAMPWATTIPRLPEYMDRLKDVHVENLDALDCFRYWDSPQTCFYCDPPYPATDQAHYKGYTQADFEKLIAVLDTCQGSFLLSNYDNAAAPAAWERFEFIASMSASGTVGRARQATAIKADNRERIEVVWRVIRGHNARPDVMRVMHRPKQLALMGES